MKTMIKHSLLLLCVMNSYLIANDEWKSPTLSFLENNTMEEIKYHFYLDGITLIYKDVFDKAIAKEEYGFIGYHGGSLEFRIFQDIIRIVIEEIVGFAIPQNFHFLDIPCFRHQYIHCLNDIPKYFSPDKNLGYKLEYQLFSLNQTLYGNFKNIGHTPATHFIKNSSIKTANRYIEDLKALFSNLGMDQDIVDKAYKIGLNNLKKDRGILLQIFDESITKYDFADKTCYFAYPNGYPYANKKVSEYYLADLSEFPPEIRLILTNELTLNPMSPIKIFRFDKMQPTTVKNYENEVRELIKNAKSDSELVEEWKTSLFNAWNNQ